MLDRNSGPTRVFGILIGLELEDGVCTPEQAAMRLSDSLSFIEGVGNVTVDILGEIDVVDEPPEVTETAKQAHTEAREGPEVA